MKLVTKALVFMVVGLQGHRKAPIGYYLTNSLAPDTQKELLVHALEKLHKWHIQVVCLTMDGQATNISMCSQLGCELRGNPHGQLKTSFPHTAENVT